MCFCFFSRGETELVRRIIAVKFARMKELPLLRILSGLRFRPCCPSLLFSVLSRTTRRFVVIRGTVTARRVPPVEAIVAVRAYRFCKVCPLAGCFLRKAFDSFIAAHTFI